MTQNPTTLADVQHYSLTVEQNDSAYMELDPDGPYVLAEDVEALIEARATAPAGLREAAQELLVALDDTYPEGEKHLTVSQAIDALRAALAASGAGPLVTDDA